jgi:UDP-3-O-[3-hydroxymyristoyl] glucosamine N-acyltransferase
LTLGDLAHRLGCRLEGDAGIEVVRVAGIEDAGPGDVTFLSNAKYASKVTATRASAIIADESIGGAPCAVLRTRQPYLAFARAVGVLSPPAPAVRGVHPLAWVDPSADVGPDVSIAPFVAIGARARIGARVVLYPHVVVGPGASVGDDCVIHAHASIREDVEIGRRVVLQDFVVIGSDGFGFAPRGDGTHEKIPQMCRVVIEDDVEIGAHSAVDRPAVGETRIAAGTKIDNLVQVAHGVKIGRNVLLAAQVGIAGSTVLEDQVMMAGQSGATGHVRIGRGAVVGAKSAVTKDVAPGRHVAGIPAIDVERWRETVALGRRLGEMRQALADLTERLARLERAARAGATPPDPGRP